MQKNQSNCPVCPQLLGLPCISQNIFCSFSFILACATGVNSASDKSNFKSYDLILANTMRIPLPARQETLL